MRCNQEVSCIKRNGISIGVRTRRELFQSPIEDALQEIAEEVKKQADTIPGSAFYKNTFLRVVDRQRLFTSFKSMSNPIGVGLPLRFLSGYARFCMSLPRGSMRTGVYWQMYSVVIMAGWRSFQVLMPMNRLSLPVNIC